MWASVSHVQDDNSLFREMSRVHQQGLLFTSRNLQDFFSFNQSYKKMYIQIGSLFSLHINKHIFVGVHQHIIGENNITGLDRGEATRSTCPQFPTPHTLNAVRYRVTFVCLYSSDSYKWYIARMLPLHVCLDAITVGVALLGLKVRIGCVIESLLHVNRRLDFL